jgi:hypothetical protein
MAGQGRTDRAVSNNSIDTSRRAVRPPKEDETTPTAPIAPPELSRAPLRPPARIAGRTRQAIVLALLRDRPHTTAELALALGSGTQAAYMAVYDLRAKVRKGRGSPVTWELVPDAAPRTAPALAERTHTPSLRSTRVIHGVAYEVVFDGRQSLTGDYPGGSTLAAAVHSVYRP